MLGVRGGDLVIVPEAGKAFIEGEVRKPGPYVLTRGMTLTQLISSAGGMTFPADPGRVKLVRQIGTGDSGEWEVDIEPRKNQPPPDVRLTRNDRVVIPSTLGRKTVYGVYQFVTAIVRITVGGAATIF
jgi:protein involved in polysaccharide export with SLBB domain